MVNSCAAKGCGGCRAKSSFRIPAILRNQGEQTLYSSTKRRALWIANLGRKTPPANSARICSDHFLTGKPSINPNHPDYAPQLFSHSKVTREELQEQLECYYRTNGWIKKEEEEESVSSDKEYIGGMLNLASKAESKRISAKICNEAKERIAVKRYLQESPVSNSMSQKQNLQESPSSNSVSQLQKLPELPSSNSVSQLQKLPELSSSNSVSQLQKLPELPSSDSVSRNEKLQESSTFNSVSVENGTSSGLYVVPQQYMMLRLSDLECNSATEPSFKDSSETGMFLVPEQIVKLDSLGRPLSLKVCSISQPPPSVGLPGNVTVSQSSTTDADIPSKLRKISASQHSTMFLKNSPVLGGSSSSHIPLLSVGRIELVSNDTGQCLSLNHKQAKDTGNSVVNEPHHNSSEIIEACQIKTEPISSDYDHAEMGHCLSMNSKQIQNDARTCVVNEHHQHSGEPIVAYQSKTEPMANPFETTSSEKSLNNERNQDFQIISESCEIKIEPPDYDCNEPPPDSYVIKSHNEIL